MSELIGNYEARLSELCQFIQDQGKDPDEIVQCQWK